MDAKPPQTLEELAQLVPDPSAAKALVALVRRVTELEAELRKRDEVIRATHGFLRNTFRTTYDDYRKAAKVSGAPASGDSAPEDGAPLSDHEELTNARSRDDFLEVCRRAFKIVETTTYTYLSAVRVLDPTGLEAVWNEQQAARENATQGGKYPHTARALPNDWKESGVYITDLIETSFLLLYEDRYRKGTPSTEPVVRDRYFTILTIREARHPSSHGQEEPATIEQRLGEIRSGARRKEALKLYKTRGIDGYDRLVGPVYQYEMDAVGDIAAREQSATASPSSEVSGP